MQNHLTLHKDKQSDFDIKHRKNKITEEKQVSAFPQYLLPKSEVVFPKHLADSYLFQYFFCFNKRFVDKQTETGRGLKMGYSL